MKANYNLTAEGKKKVEKFIAECSAKRKEILDAKKDTGEETNLPTVEDILADLSFTGIDDDGEYCNCWQVTDNCDSDGPLSLKIGVDFVQAKVPEHLKYSHALIISCTFDDNRVYAFLSKDDAIEALEKDYHMEVEEQEAKRDMVSSTYDAKLADSKEYASITYTYEDGTTDMIDWTVAELGDGANYLSEISCS